MNFTRKNRLNSPLKKSQDSVAGIASVIQAALYIVILLLFCLPNLANAQITEIKTGDKVRITAPRFLGKKIIGEVITTSDSTIHIQVGASNFHMPVNSIDNLEISGGYKKQPILTGFLAGSLTGGLVLGLEALDPNHSGQKISGELFPVGFAIGFIGGVFGGLASKK